MWIQSVEFKDENLGLKDIALYNLGRIVILAGPNGAGKTRLLNIIRDEASKSNSMILSFEGSKKSGEIDIVDYKPIEGVFNYPEKFPASIVNESEKNLKKCSFAEINYDGLLFLDKIKDISGKLDEFNKLFKDILNFEININTSNHVEINGFTYRDMNLSEGQEILLKFCIGLYCHNSNDNLLLLIDEPETHLHPYALIRVIESIINKFHNAQIWIATHSLVLISYLGTDCTWYMNEGRCSKVGSDSEKLLKGLIGVEEHRSKLFELLELPEVFASNKFASECLFDPNVISAIKKQDIQIELVKNSLDSLGFNTKIKILDFGAGKGRLLQCLSEEGKIKDKLDYYAYDISDINCKKCKEEISFIYGLADCKDRYYNDISSLVTKSKGEFDVILLINVFHEIDPSVWEEIFGHKGNIYKLLSKTGILIIVENELLTYGEKPFNNGYIVLNEKSVKIFLNTEEVETKRSDKKQNLVAHIIKKKSLKNITKKTVFNAIKDVLENAKKEVKKLRLNKASSFYSGIRHGFWTQQVTNATLILDDFNNKEINNE